MKIYAVGGAVRDGLMGKEAHDRDWVVVGSTPDEMASLGYLPVGRDFPVFLHPQTHEEYALARAEKKVSVGHGGFQFFCSPNVTLDEDLRRRDLTVNAMARAMDESGQWTGPLIDPCGGERDLREKILRHVGEAFAEDPLRVLRVARFCARWPDFHIAEETLALCQKLAQSGELESLSSERIWQEVSRGLMSEKPSRMIQALRDAQAWEKIAPSVPQLWSGDANRAERAKAACDEAASRQLTLAARYALLALEWSLDGSRAPGSSLGAPERKSQEALAQRWKVSSDCADLAKLLAQEALSFTHAATASSAFVAQLLERCDALRKPERMFEALSAWAARQAVVHGQAEEETAKTGAIRIRIALDASRGVDAGAVAAACAQPAQIRFAVQSARAEAVDQALRADAESVTPPKAGLRKGPR